MKRTLLFLYVISAFIFCVNSQEKSLKYFDKTIHSILEITKQNSPRIKLVKTTTLKYNSVENLLENNCYYTLPVELNGQKIIRIGMNFSKETKNIENVLID